MAALESAPVQWRLFLRALAEEVDGMAGAAGRDALLRAIGARMARLAPLPEVSTLEALEIEVNDALADLGWGEARLEMDDASHSLRIHHARLPRIGSLSGSQGPWLTALLEGLYETWLGQQPQADTTLTARRSETGPDGTVALTYGRHAP